MCLLPSASAAHGCVLLAKQARANPIPVQGQHKKLHIVSNISKSILQSLTFSAKAAFANFFPLNSEWKWKWKWEADRRRLFDEGKRSNCAAAAAAAQIATLNGVIVLFRSALAFIFFFFFFFLLLPLPAHLSSSSSSTDCVSLMPTHFCRCWCCCWFRSIDAGLCVCRAAAKKVRTLFFLFLLLLSLRNSANPPWLTVASEHSFNFTCLCNWKLFSETETENSVTSFFFWRQTGRQLLTVPAAAWRWICLNLVCVNIWTLKIIVVCLGNTTASSSSSPSSSPSPSSATATKQNKLSVV